ARRAVGREPVGRCLAAEIEIAEKERLVVDDRTAEAEAALPIAELADRRRHARVGDRRDLADQALIAAEIVGGAAEGIASASGDRVDPAAREPALANVVGRDDELKLGDRIQADGLRSGLPAGRAGRREAEQVVV